MRFGRSRATAAAAMVHEAATPEPATPYELAAVELMTMDGPMRGWIATEGARTSDWLNSLEEAPIHALAHEDTDGPVPSPLAVPAETMARDRIIWVVPPPLPPNRHLRLHRRRVRVELELDSATVIGHVHVRPGADASDWVLRGTRSMLPLTEVEIHPGGGAAYRLVPVLVVNTKHVTRMAAEGGNRRGITEAGQPGRAQGAASAAPSAPTAPTVPAAMPASAVNEAGHALVVLLEAGVIDVMEFQQFRARMAAAPG